VSKTWRRSESDYVGFFTDALQAELFSDSLELEQYVYDPKESELYLCRLKLDESLVEDRSDTNVQIVRQMWV